MSGETLTDGWEVCRECGLRVGPGEPSCAALRDGLLARDFQQPALYWKYHRLAVDAYCLQHSPYVESAKSLAAHLCGLCAALEHANDLGIVKGIQRWLDTYPDLRKPPLPSFQGSLTIAHVCAIDEPLAYGQAVEDWARSVWEAYRDLQPLARKWLALSRVGPEVRPRK